MDYDNYNPYGNDFDNHSNPYAYPKQNNPQNKFEKLAVLLGTLGLFSFTFIYGTYILGALAILFALLSKGGNMKMSSKSKRGLVLGIAGIIISTAFYGIAFYIAFSEFGSLEGILRQYCEMMGYDFEELYGQLFGAISTQLQLFY
ncbi:MAG: hypothetical protein IKJ01_08745 [Lachnospiraceae bacterium]|nr:hypothetical protein [Lachnospiraceae bacterium]